MIEFTDELTLYDLTKIDINVTDDVRSYLIGLFPIKNDLNLKDTIYDLIKNYINDFFNENTDVDPLFNLYVKRTNEQYVVHQYISELPNNEDVEILHGQIRTIALSENYIVTMIGIIERNKYGDCIDISIHVIVEDKNRS